MCGVVHQFEILNCFQFHRLAHIAEEFPQKNEWEKDDFQNDFYDCHDEQIGKLNDVHEGLTPEPFVHERQDYITCEDS